MIDSRENSHGLSFRAERLDVMNETECLAAAKLIAEAMCFDSAWAYIFGKGNTEALEWLIYRNLWVHKGETIVYRSTARKSKEAKNEIIGTCTISPPAKKMASTWEKIKLGLFKLPFLFGFDSLHRLMEVDSFFQKHSVYARNQQTANLPMYNLHMMAVRKELRGKGYGSKIIKDCLEHQCGDGLPGRNFSVALNTQTDRNVVFYQRLGFTILQSNIFCGGPAEGGFRSTIMEYKPS
jgi:GNAT superfamily N-acetyltransferase